MFPCLPRDVKTILRNEKVREADLWYETLTGDSECLELFRVTPAMKRCVAVAECLSHFNYGEQIAVLLKLFLNVFAESRFFIIGKIHQFLPIGDTGIIVTGAMLIPLIRCAIDFRVNFPVDHITDYIVGTDCVPASFFA